MSRKNKEGVEYFSVKFYDPNSTAGYTRVEAHHSEGLRGVTLKDMLNGPSKLEEYSPARLGPVVLTSVCLTPLLRPEMNRSEKPAVSAEAMYWALSWGSLADVSQMFATLSNWTAEAAAADPKNGPLQILIAASGFQKKPGLSMAVQYGHSETVTAFVDGVLESKHLDRSQKAQMIAARGKGGMPSLYIVMSHALRATVPAMREEGVRKGITAYIEAVLAGEALGINLRMALISAKHGERATPALSAGLQLGRTAAVEAYARAVLESAKLSGPQKVELLTASDNRGTSGLAAAQRRQRACTGIQTPNGVDTTKAFIRVIQQSSLDDTEKHRLCAPLDASLRPQDCG